jgi:hypothetical protein
MKKVHSSNPFLLFSRLQKNEIDDPEHDRPFYVG